MDADDESTLRSLPAGNRFEVARLFDAHADSIFGYASKRVGGVAAHDVVSEVFLIAMDRFGHYRPDLGSPRAWLYGIANNVLRHHWRSELRQLNALTRHHRETVTPADPLVAIDARLDARSEIDELVKAVISLPVDDRELLVMFAWERLTYQAIADVIGVPIGTVRSRIHRIRRLLENQREGRHHESA